MTTTRKPRIVIVGAGFGGLFAAKALKRAEADVTLVDRRNYHLFQPLLYQVAATPVGRWLGAETDRAGRVIVEPDLSTSDHPDIFVIGDAALVRDQGGEPIPGIAPAAKQQGRYVARLIMSRIGNTPPPPAYRYRHAGNLATVGRKSAVAEFPLIRLRGWLAWWIWGVAHIYFLLGVPSPLLVSLRWLWEYVTYRRGARLITGAEHAD